ncbi:DciA family protein [Anaeromyxobacter terrae]|uniref:DciA family protein n=1 Tax=Anaeromyxobacter terrae TaxID=2925406 RepID=UPI001F594A46|nr:DciA family protein [Anaeromyxobacter sp. SG22]
MLAETFSQWPAAQGAALTTAFADACGPRLAREVSMRGVLRDGRLLVLVRSEEWAAQLVALESPLCERVNARLGRVVASGLEVRVAPER